MIARARPIDLAREADFVLGGLEVKPSSREVRGAAGLAIAEPRVLQMLIALADAGGAVASRDELVARCWEGRIVGEDAIHRAVAKARRLAKLASPPAFVIESVPRVGYRLIPTIAPGLHAGTEPAQPDSAAKTDEPVAPAPVQSRVWRRRALIAGGGATLVVGAAAVALRPWRAADGQSPLVAVLPFDNLTADSGLGYFADGLSEDILNQLSRAGGMRVTARSSSFSFRGPDKAKAAGALNAAYLVDGSVLRDGGRMRVMAHLSDARTLQVLWSDTYDRDTSQGFAIEDEVASQVAAALKARLTPVVAAAHPADAEAYQLFLKGRETARVHTAEGVRDGINYLTLALQRAPGFSEGWSELAKAYWLGGFYQGATEQARSYAEGRRAAVRALALDPDNGAAHGALAMLTPRHRHWGEQEAGLRRGLALAPNDVTLLMWYADLLRDAGRAAASLAPIRRARALDPLEIYVANTLFECLLLARRYAEAERLVDDMTRLWPGQVAGYWNRVWLYACSGRERQAAALLSDVARRPAAADADYDAVGRALSAAVSGSAADKAEAAREWLALGATRFGFAGEGIALLSHMGRLDEAMTLVEAAYLHPGPAFLEHPAFGVRGYLIYAEEPASFLFHPLTEPLRRSGRLAPVFDALGLAAYWRQVGGPDAP